MAGNRRTAPDGVNPDTGEIEPGTDVEVVTGQAMAPWEARPGNVGLDEYLMNEGLYSEPSPDQAYRQIIDQILNAATPEDVLTPVDAISATDVIDRPFFLYGFDVNKSEYDVGSPFYASMHVRFMDEDSPAVVNSGNQALFAQLIRLSQFENGFPCTVVIRQGRRPNRHGTFPLRLNSAVAPRPAEPDAPGF